MIYEGRLPVNAHAKGKILNLNLTYINSFIFYSSANRLSNDTALLPIIAGYQLSPPENETFIFQ